MNNKLMWIISIIGLIIILLLGYFLIFNRESQKVQVISDFDKEIKMLDADLNTIEKLEDEQNLEVQKDSIEEDTAIDELDAELNNLDKEILDFDSTESELNQLFQ
jgi:peptidoglycan hydrolase CwlO-like protein